MPKVIGGFKCPYTKKIYHVGDEYDGDHLEEMQKKGYIKEPIDMPEKEKPSPKSSPKRKE